MAKDSLGNKVYFLGIIFSHPFSEPMSWNFPQLINLSMMMVTILVILFLSFRYVAEVFGYVYKHRRKIRGYIITWAPPVLRHFSVRLKPMPPSVKMEEEEEGQEVARQVQGCCNSFSRLVL